MYKVLYIAVTEGFDKIIKSINLITFSGKFITGGAKYNLNIFVCFSKLESHIHTGKLVHKYIKKNNIIFVSGKFR